MKSSSQYPLAALLTLLLCTSLFPLELASARPRGGGARRCNYRSGSFRSGVARRGNYRSGGASPRINSSVNLQNRGNINTYSGNRSQYQQNRQGQRTERQGNRQITQQDRQREFTERTDIRQRESTDRQRNRQDFVDDNYYGGRWYGGGWYGGGYRVPPGWGWATFTTGLVLGATIATPPPYYSTVYVGSTNYIYSDGVFLQPSGSSYVVVNPPVGAVVTYLPEGCTKIQTNNIVYYNCSDIYYQPFYQNGNTVYKVVQF